MITKQEVADFINATDTNKIWTPYEIAYLQGKLDPFLATMMIKLVGDVSWLVKVRDNTAREYTNNDDLS